MKTTQKITTSQSLFIIKTQLDESKNNFTPDDWLVQIVLVPEIGENFPISSFCFSVSSPIRLACSKNPLNRWFWFDARIVTVSHKH
jgi:hypothetical protein